MAANLCVEAHLRDAVENGYSAYVIKDAVGAAGEDALNAAYVNYGVHATGVLTTNEFISAVAKETSGVNS